MLSILLNCWVKVIFIWSLITRQNSQGPNFLILTETYHQPSTYVRLKAREIEVLKNGYVNYNKYLFQKSCLPWLSIFLFSEKIAYSLPKLLFEETLIFLESFRKKADWLMCANQAPPPKSCFVCILYGHLNFVWYWKFLCYIYNIICKRFCDDCMHLSLICITWAGPVQASIWFLPIQTQKFQKRTEKSY